MCMCEGNVPPQRRQQSIGGNPCQEIKMQTYDTQTTLGAENVYRYPVGDPTLTKWVKNAITQAKQENTLLRMWDEDGRFLQFPILPPYTVLTLLKSGYLILIDGQRYGCHLEGKVSTVQAVGATPEDCRLIAGEPLRGVLDNIRFPFVQNHEDINFVAVPESMFEDFEAMMKDGVAVPLSDPHFHRLAQQLRAAYLQASQGKGKERHAGKNAEGQVTQAFHDQRIVTNAKLHGLGSPCGQVSKKIAEGCDMIRRGEVERGLIEFHGAINYVAALCIAAEDGVSN